jgi:hypothetical protein
VQTNGAIAKDMEAAGVLQAVQMLNYGGLCFLVKAFSDVAYESISEQVSGEKLAAHCDVARANLRDMVNAMLANKARLL